MPSHLFSIAYFRKEWSYPFPDEPVATSCSKQKARFYKKSFMTSEVSITLASTCRERNMMNIQALYKKESSI